jgi:hypothetical protein
MRTNGVQRLFGYGPSVVRELCEIARASFRVCSPFSRTLSMSAPTGNHRGTRWFSHCARTRIRIQDFGTQGAAVGRRIGSRKWLRHMSPVNSSSLRICWSRST